MNNGEPSFRSCRAYLETNPSTRLLAIVLAFAKARRLAVGYRGEQVSCGVEWKEIAQSNRK